MVDMHFALRRLKPRKAPGPDQVSADLYKLLPDGVRRLLLEYFNACFLSASAPDHWKLARVVMIFKGGTKNSRLRVDLQTPPDREGGVCENREKRSESARGLGIPKVTIGERRTVGRDKCPKVFGGIEWGERRAKRHVACAVRARTRGARVNARRQVDRESRVEAKELALIWVEEKASFAGFVLQGVEQSMKGELRTGHQNSVVCIFDVSDRRTGGKGPRSIVIETVKKGVMWASY